LRENYQNVLEIQRNFRLQKQYQMASSNSNQNLKAISLVAILALLGLNVYQFVTNKSLQKDNIQKETEITQLDQAKTELEKQYENSVAELNEMKTNNTELNTLIDSQKEELRIQKDKISNLLKDSKNLSVARKEMTEMKSKVESYVAEISRLKQENEQLLSSNTSLTKEKENLSQDLQKKSVENSALSEAKNALTSEKEKINKEKSELSKRVLRASVITVNKIETNSYEQRDGKKPNGVSKAKNTDYLQICFNTSANSNADSGDEQFFIRVINPIGETQAIESQGSGTFINETTGDEVRYSTIAKTMYANEVKNVCGEWHNPGGFQAGVYQIEVYNKGYLAGTSTIKLK
jgi:predicted nuclease with TOPRIM domain